MENLAYLLLGSNLGKRNEILTAAKIVLEENNIKIIESSKLYKTAAWGLTDQPAFLNQVIKIETELNAFDLLKVSQQIENDFGRQREIKFGARTLDIDILYFNEEIINDENLIIPHPQIQNRNFTLIPLVEIADDYIHPILKVTNKKLLEICKDNGEVEIS